MTQMLLTISNPKDASLIRKLLAKFDGVTVSRLRAKTNTAVDIDDYQPNKTTMKAMDDARSGKTFRANSAADLIHQILG